MDYGRSILRKYGWTEGKGLGKNEKGISKPLKCELKFDKSGIGYNEKLSKEEKNQWWIQMFNQAAANISDNESVVVSKKHRKKSRSNRNSEHIGKILTDEELFEACGGRTAHKAARHGFRLSGKLKRVHQQETMNEESDISANQLPLECVASSEKKLLGFENSNETKNSASGTVYSSNEIRKKKKFKTVEGCFTPTVGIHCTTAPLKNEENWDLVSRQKKVKLVCENDDLVKNETEGNIFKKKKRKRNNEQVSS